MAGDFSHLTAHVDRYLVLFFFPSVLHTIINGPEVMSSPTDKTKLFTKILASNSTLNDKVYPFSDFPPRSTNLVIFLLKPGKS